LKLQKKEGAVGVTCTTSSTPHQAPWRRHNNNIMGKRVSVPGADRVEAALRNAADALRTSGENTETPRRSSRHNSNANSKTNSRNSSANNSCTHSPQKESHGLSSAKGVLAVPPVLARKTAAQSVLTTREKADAHREAALADGDKPAREKLAREIAGKEKAAEVKAAKAVKKAAEVKAKAKAAEVKAAKVKAAKAVKKAAELQAAKAVETLGPVVGNDCSDDSNDVATSDDHASDGSFQGSDKASASRKRRLDKGLEDSESEGELIPKTRKKTAVPRQKDLPTRRQHQTVPKRPAKPSISRSNSLLSPSTSRDQLPPASPAFVQVGDADVAQDAGERAILFAAVRQAFADIGPHDTPRPPFIYWAPDKVHSCALKVIARNPLLQQMSQKYNRRNDFAKKHGQAVRTHANNERSAQIRTMKAMWLNNQSYISLVYHDESKLPVTVSLSDDLKSLGSVEDLRNILFSDAMYTFPAVYNIICLGLESGNFKSTSACGLTTISDLLTPAHEAHFRLELWYALPHHRFGHSISNKHAKERIAKWTEFLPLVLKDRKDNETEAHQTRKFLNAKTAVPENEQEDDDNNDDEAGSEYW
jgi:hypothetical protein